MERQTLDKIARRARSALRKSTRAALNATTERALKRHERRAAQARKALIRMDYDAGQWGAAFSQD